MTATEAAASAKPVPNPVRFAMMLIAVCLVYTGIGFGDGIYDFLRHLPISIKIIDALKHIQSFLDLDAAVMAWLTKASLITAFLLPVFTAGCILITRSNKYLKISAIPFLSFSVGFLLKFLFGWNV